MTKLWSDDVLRGTRMIVTGAAHGLGWAIAIASVRAGAQVLFTATNRAALEQTVKEAAPDSGQAAIHVANLARPEEVDGIYNAAVAAFGGVDVLINNAGVSVDSLRNDYWTNPVRYWEPAAVAEYRRFFEINALAVIRLCLLVTPGMQARNWGRMINVSTSLNTMIAGGMGPYGCSKAAMEAFTATMAADLAGSGVTANIMAPGGPSDTRMIVADIPREDLLPVDCLAAPAVWLSSDLADGVSGQRFLGSKWDPKLPPAQASIAAGAPIAWTGFGAQSYVPPGHARVE